MYILSTKNYTPDTKIPSHYYHVFEYLNGVICHPYLSSRLVYKVQNVKDKIRVLKVVHPREYYLLQHLDLKLLKTYADSNTNFLRVTREITASELEALEHASVFYDYAGLRFITKENILFDDYDFTWKSLEMLLTICRKTEKANKTRNNFLAPWENPEEVCKYFHTNEHNPHQFLKEEDALFDTPEESDKAFTYIATQKRLVRLVRGC
jgi:hypothetical protein